jgi:hypothetical protein
VWAQYFRGVDSRQVRRLDTALSGNEDVAVVAEQLAPLLAGLRRDADFRRVRDVFLRLPIVSPSIQARVEAATLDRTLRTKHVRLDRAQSCLTSQTCMELGAEILSAHGDYNKIAKHSRLKLCNI